VTRIALGGVWHETNTFVPGRTGLEDFHRYQFAVGDKLLDSYGGTGTELGGAIDAASQLDVDVVPLAYAAAVPSGIVAAPALDKLTALLVDQIEGGGSVDAVVLALHGAMVAEGEPDTETTILRAVRRVVGDRPITVTLDLHANPSVELARTADTLVIYDTFPHVDMWARGSEALRLAERMIRQGVRPDVHLEKLPLLTVPQMQDTDDEPMRSVGRTRQQLEDDPLVWIAGLASGYPYSDVERLGVSAYVAADANADALARELARATWVRRSQFVPQLLEPADAVARAATATAGPIVLVDVADNVGGGSPGDGTVLLRALQERGGRDGAIVIWDPWTVKELYASERDRGRWEVGGHATAALGDPVPVEGEVRRLGVVGYTRTGRYMQGQTVDMGRVAALESRMGTIVLTERRVMPFDDDHLRAVGVEPERRRVIVAKSASAWKGAFGAYAHAAFYVRTPGYCPSDLGQLPFSRRPRPAYPLEEDAIWP
jgi:microcystin degradation protein MlrC